MGQYDKDGDGMLQLDEYLKLVDEMKEQNSGYTHVSFCNGTCGGQCNPWVNHPKAPPRLPAPVPSQQVSVGADHVHQVFVAYDRL